MLHTLRPPINLQYTQKQENLNTTHCVSTKWLTIVLIHPKAGKPQCYTRYVHPATYITLEEGVKQSLLGCVAFVGVHHQQMANLSTHTQTHRICLHTNNSQNLSTHTKTHRICLHMNNSQNLSTHKIFIESVYTQTTHRICQHTNNSHNLSTHKQLIESVHIQITQRICLHQYMQTTHRIFIHTISQNLSTHKQLTESVYTNLHNLSTHKQLTESVYTQTTHRICPHTNNSQNLSTHKQLTESVHTHKNS